MRLDEEPLGPSRCVHGYGHGGGGVALSWGCGHELTGMLKGGKRSDDTPGPASVPRPAKTRLGLGRPGGLTSAQLERRGELDERAERVADVGDALAMRLVLRRRE